MSKKSILSIVILQIAIFTLIAQTDLKKLELNGYFSHMGSYMKTNSIIAEADVLDNLIHNRLNIFWYPNNKITGSLQLRNQFLVGDQIRNDTLGLLKKLKKEDLLSVNLIEDNSFILNSIIDRLYLKYTIDNLDITLGKQRINWGQTFVFNANDIFNAYSFFDFDYPERPGSDALRIQFYPNYTSTIEAAIKYDNDSTVTAAALGRFSKWNYDMQIIGGIYNSKEVVLGGGWAGNIKSYSFSGEFSYLHPQKNFKDTSGLFFASMNINYMFSNSLMLQIEGFYNQYLSKKTISFADLMVNNQDLKSLTVSELTFFTSLSYPLNPLFNTSISLMYYPDVKGFNFFPSFDFSISDKAKFSVIGMYFKGEFNYPEPMGKQTDKMYMGFLRFKYGF